MSEEIRFLLDALFVVGVTLCALVAMGVWGYIYWTFVLFVASLGAWFRNRLG